MARKLNLRLPTALNILKAGSIYSNGKNRNANIKLSFKLKPIRCTHAQQYERKVVGSLGFCLNLFWIKPFFNGFLISAQPIDVRFDSFFGLLYDGFTVSWFLQLQESPHLKKTHEKTTVNSEYHLNQNQFWSLPNNPLWKTHVIRKSHNSNKFLGFLGQAKKFETVRVAKKIFYMFIDGFGLFTSFTALSTWALSYFIS